jgi:hypothetical protein
MNQAVYAHMNNKRKIKKKEIEGIVKVFTQFGFNLLVETFYFTFSFSLVVLVFELRASVLLGRCSTT